MAINKLSTSILFIADVVKMIVNKDYQGLKMNPDIEFDGRLTRVVSNFIIKPNIVVSKKLEYMDSSVFKNIVKLHTTIFASYYVQAFKIMFEIYGASVDRVVGSLTPNKQSPIGTLRNIANSDLVKYVVGKESRDYMSELISGDINFMEIGTEDSKDGVNVSSSNLIKDINEVISTYEITLRTKLEDGEERAVTIPVIIQPNIIFTNTTELVSDIFDSKNETGFFSRLDQVLAGAISWFDMIFAGDLVRKYKKDQLRNKNSFGKYLREMSNISTVKDILFGRVSFARNYNLYLFDQSELPSIESSIRGSIYKEKYKNELTDKLHAFSVTPIDAQKETVTIFIDSIDNFSVLNFKMVSKEKGGDINEIFQKLMINKPPF